MIKKSFLVVVFVWLCAQNVYAATKSIVILGDSLSASYGMEQQQGWIHLLNQRFSEKNLPYHIINASISGETTAGGLARLPKILSQTKIDYLVIELGGNDGLRGFPPKIIKNNLLQMITLAKEKNIPIAIMQIKIPPNYGEKYNQLFTDTFKQVTMDTNVPLLPFFIEDIAIEPQLMQKDGIHPNVMAQPLIVDTMEKQLQNLVKDN